MSGICGSTMTDSDSWQTVPTKHRTWAASASGSGSSSAFTQKDTGHEQGRSFSSFGTRNFGQGQGQGPANRVMPAAFSNKRGNDSRREEEEQRRQWHIRLEHEAHRVQEEEEKSLRDALTIESEREYPSLQSSPKSPKKGSNSLNFKAIVEAPASPNVPKVTVVGNGKPVIRPHTPTYPPYQEYDEDEEDEEFNAHIGSGRRGGGDAW